MTFSLVVAAIVPTVVSAGIAAAYGHSPFSAVWLSKYIGPLQVSLLLIALLLGVVYLSTLVDWYYTLPRVSGLVWDDLPCTNSVDRRWLTVTRNWQLHRWLTEVAGIGLLAGFVVSLAYFLLPDVSSRLATAVVITASVLGLVVQGFRLNGRLDRVVDNHMNPGIYIGRLVHIKSDHAEEPVASQSLRAEHRRLHYVMDVSIQGYKLKPVNDPTTYGGPPFGAYKEDGSIVHQLDELEAVDAVFSGCAGHCSGVNWYCDNNSPSDRYR